MCGSALQTVSPFSSRTSRRTPWADGCWGPKFRLKERICSSLLVFLAKLIFTFGFTAGINRKARRQCILLTYREISGKKVRTLVSRFVTVAFARTAKVRLVTIFIADRNLNMAVTLSRRNPPVYKIKVQKAVEKKVAWSICGMGVWLLCRVKPKSESSMLGLYCIPKPGRCEKITVAERQLI